MVFPLSNHRECIYITGNKCKREAIYLLWTVFLLDHIRYKIENLVYKVIFQTELLAVYIYCIHVHIIVSSIPNI